jgi:DUF1365 family protein
VPHEFEYRIFLTYIDLDELEASPVAGRFRRRDYLGDPRVPLDDAVRDLVGQRLGDRPRGPIRLLTHLSYLGHNFNPVSFYYCFQPDGAALHSIVAEITNTPWNERHSYVLPARDGLRFQFDKQFHVSPFFPMDHRYDWRFTVPGPTLAVHMENHAGGERVFDATMTLERRPLTRWSYARSMAAYPMVTAKVVAAIYWQAFRLWAKRAPFHSHPKHVARGRDE